MKKTILHLSYDLRRSISTTAVRNLIESSADNYNYVAVDLLRVPSLKMEKVTKQEEHYLEINSFGLPFSLFLISNLNRAYDKISGIIKSGSKIDIIHAHKLTYEGYIGYKLAKEYNIPLVITLRQTDFELLKFRPDLRNMYKNILAYSSKIFYIVPGMKKFLEESVGEKFYCQNIADKMVYLPNIIDCGYNSPVENGVYNRNLLLTILRMTKKSVKRKNIKRLFMALSGIKDLNWELNIIGSGDYLNKIEEWAGEFGIRDHIYFTGEINNSQIGQYYSQSAAFILPSLMESFGMVYAESLLNNTPILYSKGVLGFDGVFNNVGPAVDPFSVESIRIGIKDIIQNNEYYRKNIQKLSESGSFDIFNSDYIGRVYSGTVKELL